MVIVTRHEISLAEYVDHGKATLQKRVFRYRIADRPDTPERVSRILERIHELAHEHDHRCRRRSGQLPLFTEGKQ